jgi:hypothetical protein
MGTMKAASGTKPAPPRASRVRDTADASPVRARDEVTFADQRFLGQQVPLSLAPYRLQAADRWWRESCAQPEPRSKRHQ